MIQVRQIVMSWPGATNGAVYFHPLTPTQKTWGTVSTSGTIELPAAGTIRNLAVRLLSALGGGDAITVRFDVNGSASALTATVTDPATTAADTVNSLSLNAGDTLALVRTGSGLPAAGSAMVSYEWEPTVANTSIYGFGGQTDTIGTSTHRDGLLDGGGNTWDELADDIKTLVALSGTVTALRVVLSAAPSFGNSRTFTIYKNGTAQDGAGGTPDTRLTISDAATSGAVAFSLAIAAGDYLWIETSHTGAPAAVRACGSVALVSSTGGQWHVGAVLASPTDAVSTLYIGSSGRSDGGVTTWDATETNRQHIGGVTGFYLGGMIGRLSAAPGVGKSVAYTLRKNAADTVQALSFADANTSASTAGDPVQFTAQTDLLAVKEVPTGAPTVGGSFPKLAWWAANAINAAPVPNAGPDQTVAFGAVVQLAGSATDDGQPDPPAALTYAWSKVSGPGTVAFSNDAIAAPTVTFSAVGVYVLRLTVSDSALSASDDVSITVSNNPPVVDAGDDQEIRQNQAANLAGSVTDDGQPDPPAAVTVTWSKTSGPGTVTFADASSLATAATFSAIGSYVLRLTATDGDLSAYDEVAITVGPRLMRRLRIAPHVSNENNQIGIDRLRLDLETGAGLSSGQGSDPQLMLRWSNDGGQTFGNEHWVSAGAIGNYKARAQWFRLGVARDRVFELTVSDPIPWRILGAFIEVRGGRS
jgi:hypothetical protein